ncbi:MAG: SDR family oxidoreductase [Chlorobi bacterium]|nr:SDR family oxidoreductase [Chlorobiota bacterium]
MGKTLQGKVVIVTGASSGIGFETARMFAESGCRIVMAARNTDHLYQAGDELKKAGYDVLPVQTDVSREEDCERLIRKTLDVYGQIDVLVNNAGISMRVLFGDIELKVFKKIMATNFWGTVYCTKFALPSLLKTKGSVVGVTSIAGIQGLPGRTAYSASKFAIHGFLETLRLEYKKQDLHVFLIAPGFTRSNIRMAAMTEKGESQGKSPRNEKRMMSPESVARCIVKGVRGRQYLKILTWMGIGTFVLRKISPRLLDFFTVEIMRREKDSPFH